VLDGLDVVDSGKLIADRLSQMDADCVQHVQARETTSWFGIIAYRQEWWPSRGGMITYRPGHNGDIS
jgi:hypothetical protein